MIQTEKYGAILTHTKQTVPRHAGDFNVTFLQNAQRFFPFHSAKPAAVKAQRRAEGQKRPFFHSLDTLPVTAPLESV